MANTPSGITFSVVCLLGPLLFIFCINNISSVTVTKAKVKIFGDEVLCISNKCSLPKFDYRINDILLKRCYSVKHQGVYINSKLSWNVHCSANTAKAMRVLSIIRCNLWLFCGPKIQSFQGASDPNTRICCTNVEYTYEEECC